MNARQIDFNALIARKDVTGATPLYKTFTSAIVSADGAASIENAITAMNTFNLANNTNYAVVKWYFTATTTRIFAFIICININA